LQRILRSQVPLSARWHTEETVAPSGHTDGEIGGSGPQSVGAQSALPPSEPVAEPGPAVFVLGWLEPHAIKKARVAAKMCFVMLPQRSPAAQLTRFAHFTPCHTRGMRFLLLLAFVTVAEARPARGPVTQPLTCPSAADTCELDIAGTLVYSRRDPLAKWDNLRISPRKDELIYASINIPNRTRLKLVEGKRYTFKIRAHSPFGAGDLWVIDAKPR
jgi:hypothetical protein